MRFTEFIRHGRRDIIARRSSKQCPALGIAQAVGCAVALVVLLPLQQNAHAGSITDVNVSRNFPAVQENVDVSVDGDGVCTFDLVLGEDYTLQNQAHDFGGGSWSDSHSWQSKGIKLITAIGRGDCADTSASATVNVQDGDGPVFTGNLDALCKILDCEKANIAPAKIKEMAEFLSRNDPYKGVQEILGKMIPVIEGAMGFPGWGSVSPGATLSIKGRNFLPRNNEQVQVMLHGSFPGGVLQLGGIEILSDTAISAAVPPAMTGVPDHVVQIQIKKGPIFGNKFDFSFLGTRQTWLLRISDPAVQVVHCGHDGNTNRCNSSGSANSEFGWSITGLHTNAWAAVGDDKGTDHYRITLKNNWVFKSYEKKMWWKTSADEELSGPTPAFPEGESVWDFKISWVVSPNDKVHYGLDVIVEGPLGMLPW